MMLDPYRRALAVPGVRSLLLVGTLARVPLTATGVTLTLYVVLVLERGYGAAGLIGTATTVGMAVGSPLLGRLVDRHGLRPVVGWTTAAQAVFWGTAPLLPYETLLVASFVGGLLSPPVFSLIRQSIAAVVPEDLRRPAYALDSMTVELSFMAGPALAVLLATTWSPRASMVAVGGGIVLAGLALFALNPPTRSEDEPDTAGRPVRRREWLTGRLIGVLTVAAASTLVLGGTDVAVVAVLRAADQVEWTGLVLAMWAGYSLVGGFVYGSVSRSFSPVLLGILLGVFTIPVGFTGGQWWLLGLTLLPAGALCAPTLAATVDAVSRLTPPSARGEVMGLHGSALTLGLALGAPLAGAVIDASSPAWGFAATGLVGALAALAALLTILRRPSAPSGLSHPSNPSNPSNPSHSALTVDQEQIAAR